jgi:hypothetical protein
MQTVKCTKCGNDGRAYEGRSECMTCSRKRFLAYYAKNRDRKLEYMREYDRKRREALTV